MGFPPTVLSSALYSASYSVENTSIVNVCGSDCEMKMAPHGVSMPLQASGTSSASSPDATGPPGVTSPQRQSVSKPPRLILLFTLSQGTGNLFRARPSVEASLNRLGIFCM